MPITQGFKDWEVPISVYQRALPIAEWGEKWLSIERMHEYSGSIVKGNSLYWPILLEAIVGLRQELVP